jgi:hypothetical protein
MDQPKSALEDSVPKVKTAGKLKQVRSAVSSEDVDGHLLASDPEVPSSIPGAIRFTEK